MSMTFARLLDPCFEDDDDPFRHYDYRGEPLEDRLYLTLRHRPPQEGLPRRLCPSLAPSSRYPEPPSSTEPASLRCPVARRRRPTPGRTFPGHTSSTSLKASGPYWRPYRLFLHQLGLPTATVSGRQTKRAGGTGTRKKRNDLQSAFLVAKVFKQGESHASRIPPEPLATLREYTRLHLFFVATICCSPKPHV